MYTHTYVCIYIYIYTHIYIYIYICAKMCASTYLSIYIERETAVGGLRRAQPGLQLPASFGAFFNLTTYLLYKVFLNNIHLMKITWSDAHDVLSPDFNFCHMISYTILFDYTIYVYVYIYIYIYIYIRTSNIYIYIYTERERERERCRYLAVGGLRRAQPGLQLPAPLRLRRVCRRALRGHVSCIIELIIIIIIVWRPCRQAASPGHARQDTPNPPTNIILAIFYPFS